MNERIKELLAEAKLFCYDDGTVSLHGEKYTGQEEIEKFAEMIVQECIKEIGYKSVELLDIEFYPHYQARLKKHFGVE